MDKKKFKLKFPKKEIVFEGTSAYAETVTLESMGHVLVSIKRLVEQNESLTCVDVGANIGLTTLLLDQIISGGKIFSFEPHPKTFSQLERNTIHNKTGRNEIELFQFGLGSSNQELKFRDIDRYNTGNSILTEGSLAEQVQATITVPVRKLDDFEEIVGDVHLIKIDVEGFELDVLKGGKRVVDKAQAVLIEFNHWCLSSIARILPVDALESIFAVFEAVFVFDAVQKRFKRITTGQEKWGFLHKNMVNFNVNDLLCTNSPSVIDTMQK